MKRNGVVVYLTKANKNEKSNPTNGCIIDDDHPRFSSCVEDSCSNTLCQNGGVWNQGDCMCPEGFRGANCEERILPYRMRLSFVTLTRFPSKNDGLPWDEDNGPDIYFSLYEDTFSVGKPLELILDAAVDQIYPFHIDVIEMRDINSVHHMRLYDYEAFNQTPQFMGEVAFTPFNIESGFPDTLVLDNGGPVAFIIGVTYLYPNQDDLANP